MEVHDIESFLHSNKTDLNRIFQGDCREILKKLPDNFFDLLVTDPPYFIMNKQDLPMKTRAPIVQNASFDHFDSYESFIEFTRSWIKSLVPKMKEDATMYIFFAGQYITDLLRICEEFGFEYVTMMVWYKTNPVPKIRKTKYLSATEFLLHVSRGKPTFNFLGQRKMHNVLRASICCGKERLQKDGQLNSLHPAQKPESIIEKLIKVSSNKDQWVCDPFAGTGTVNAVCKKMRRQCIGIEKDKEYFERATKRLLETRKTEQKTTLTNYIS